MGEGRRRSRCLIASCMCDVGAHAALDDAWPVAQHAQMQARVCDPLATCRCELRASSAAAEALTRPCHPTQAGRARRDGERAGWREDWQRSDAAGLQCHLGVSGERVAASRRTRQRLIACEVQPHTRAAACTPAHSQPHKHTGRRPPDEKMCTTPFQVDSARLRLLSTSPPDAPTLPTADPLPAPWPAPGPLPAGTARPMRRAFPWSRPLTSSSSSGVPASRTKTRAGPDRCAAALAAPAGAPWFHFCQQYVITTAVQDHPCGAGALPLHMWKQQHDCKPAGALAGLSNCRLAPAALRANACFGRRVGRLLAFKTPEGFGGGVYASKHCSGNTRSASFALMTAPGLPCSMPFDACSMLGPHAMHLSCHFGQP